NERGVFEMTGAGLVGVPDPSELFGHTAGDEAGAAVACALEGTRPILLEIQALVAPTDLAMPGRVGPGVDPKRLAMIVAVLSRHAGVALGQADVFVNVAGGVRIDEPGADLAIALAVVSAAKGSPLKPKLAAFGEIGLTGRLRPAAQAERRLEECAKLGLVAAVAPAGTELRQAIDDIIRSSEGALIVIGEPNDLAFLLSGGMRLDQSFTPQFLYELAKMDGAIIVNTPVTKIAHANVQLMPDPTIPSNETGTRHRTAERVAKQTEALVISISQQRETVTVFVGDSRYQLDPIADVLAKTNQALATLETYRQRLDQVLTRLTALEFQNAVMLDDVLVVLQRAELTTRMADYIERACT